MERGSRRRLNSEMKMFGSKSSNIKLEMSEQWYSLGFGSSRKLFPSPSLEKVRSTAEHAEKRWDLGTLQRPMDRTER